MKRFITAIIIACIGMATPMTSSAYDVFKHKKNFSIGYSLQSFEGGGNSFNSDWGANLEMGRTIFFHKKPLANLLKIGLDLNFSADYAKFKEIDTYADVDIPGFEPSYGDDDNDLMDLGVHQLNLGVAIGPSVTFALPKDMRARVYFHFIPAWSCFIQNSDVNSSFVPFFGGGASIGWKAISLGYEFRGGSGNFKSMLGELMDEFGASGVATDKVKYNTTQ